MSADQNMTENEKSLMTILEFRKQINATLGGHTGSISKLVDALIQHYEKRIQELKAREKTLIDKIVKLTTPKSQKDTPLESPQEQKPNPK